VSRAFRWTPSGGVQDLGSLIGNCTPGRTSFATARAFAINNAGRVVGWSIGNRTAPLNEHAVVWSAPNVIQDLGLLPGGTRSVANDINNNNQVVGWANIADFHVRAVLWTLR
jgi:probable HAF family extracellular repeat protein